MGSRWTMAGMEVPIIGSDSVRWIEVSVPSSSSTSSLSSTTTIHSADANANASTFTTTCAPLTDDFASSSVIGNNPPTHIIWKIHKSRPNAMELIELCASKEFPRTGLRITFPDALSPFAFVCKNEVDVNSRNHPYLLYALTVSGVAYLLRIRSISIYSSCSVFTPDEFLIGFDMRPYGPITSAAVTASGCIVVGRNDGSVGCFQLGTLDPTAPGFVHELQDDSGFGRFWGFMSRGRMVGAVRDMVMSEIHGKQLLFVLHSDGILQVWDLSCNSKVFSHTMNVSRVAGTALVRLWVGDAERDSNIISLAVLCRHTLEISSEIIHLYSLQCSFGDKVALLLDPSIQSIPLGEVGCIDVKLTSDKIWILKDNGLVLQSLFGADGNAEHMCYYALQEDFVADQLFQSPENSLDDLLLIAHSIFSSAKDHIVSVVSSIFLRKLLHPGVHHNIALRSTFLEYNRHWTDFDFQTLTADGLKKEILSLIEHEGIAENLISIHCSWKNFCTRYFHNWCKSNAPCGLIVESSAGAVGLIRNNSLSVFRCLEDIERLTYGSSEGLGDLVNFGLDVFDDDLDHEVLVDLLRCVASISQHLGKTASAIFYEALVSTPVISSEEVVPRILKILETGYSSAVATFKIPELGTHVAGEKKLMDHKSLRKFSVDMLLSVHALCRKAVTWSKVLSVIESYLKFLVPQKVVQNLDAEPLLDINASILVQATSQVAKMMFESALDILLFLSYLVNNSGQFNILPADISKIQLELVPMIQEIISEWFIVHYFATTPSESAVIEDFSSQLSLLQIDSSTGKRSWNEKLGKCEFPLAFIFLLKTRISSGDQTDPHSRCLPYLHDIIGSMRNFVSWIIWGKSGESSALLSHSTELALVLLRHGQYDAVEHLLSMVEAHSKKEKTSESIQDTDGGWCILHHLLGCCFLAQAQRGLHGMLKERKVSEAVRCFFRASSVKDAYQALQSLPQEAALPLLDFTGIISGAAWKLHYYQCVMQIFEQYYISEGACQFALAALEQVEEALNTKDEHHGGDPFNESVTTIKGRLWSNVFKFTLDLNHYYDAYCAIISNPDEESKYICLRRLIIVLYECNAMKILCGGQLPFIGLINKVEQELVWKAERSDILMKPNLYKFLYAFEMHQRNWRRAASYIYQYCNRLRTEAALRDYQHSSLDLQERLNGLSAAINALHLVHPAYAWIDPLLDRHAVQDNHYPCKKAKRAVEEECDGFQPQKLHSYMNIEQIEKEFVLTSAEYLLLLAHVKWRFTEIHKVPSDLVDLLIQADLYDMAFTVLLKFFKGSDLKRELERVFSAISLKCCPNIVNSSWAGDDRRNHGVLLISSKDDTVDHCSPDAVTTTQQSKGISRWGTLELYLERYMGFHARLPVIVAETLLRTDPQIELPLWLVNMFKGGQREKTWGMTGQESNPALLFRIYVDYGRYTEATNLLLEYIESHASMRPADIIKRKRPFAIWFPYTAIQRLWCQLEELIRSHHMEDQCDKLKKLVHGALLKHLELLKVDSEDAISAAAI